MTQTIAITGGSVTFGEQRKLADYEGRNVVVTLTFGAPANGSAGELDVALILDMAERRVRQKQTGQEVPIPATAAAGGPKAAKSDKQKAAEAKTGGQPGSMDVVTGGPVAPSTSPASPAAAPVDPLSQPSSSPAAAPAAPQAPSGATAAPPPAASHDPLSAPAELFTGAAREITDVDLQNAITAKNEATAGKKMMDIRKAIGDYSTAANKSFTGIPQEKREAFLMELTHIQA